jgi:hypothetical protein
VTSLPAHRFSNPEGDRALEQVTLHRQLRILPAKPDQLRPLGLGQLAVTAATMPPIQRAPVAQRALVHPEIPGHLRDGLPVSRTIRTAPALKSTSNLPPLLNHHRLLNGDASTLSRK